MGVVGLVVAEVAEVTDYLWLTEEVAGEEVRMDLEDMDMVVVVELGRETEHNVA